jgi:hypothetical protein
VCATRLDNGLLSNHSFAFYLLYFARLVRDVPVAAKQLDGLEAAVFNANEVPEDELAVHYVGLPVQINGSYSDFDVACYGVVGNHAGKLRPMGWAGPGDTFDGLTAGCLTALASKKESAPLARQK